MARKPVRSLMVDDARYHYAIATIDPRYVRVTIWAATDRRRPRARVRVRFDDPWLNYGALISAPITVAASFQLEPVTPRVVADIVRAVVAAGGDHRDFAWQRDAGLAPIADAGVAGP